MSNTFDDVIATLKAEKEKYEFEQTVKKVYSRPKLTKQVKKAAAHAPGRLDCFKDENRAYSNKEVRTYLDGTSYFETYSAMRGQDSYE